MFIPLAPLDTLVKKRRLSVSSLAVPLIDLDLVDVSEFSNPIITSVLELVDVSSTDGAVVSLQEPIPIVCVPDSHQQRARSLLSSTLNIEHGSIMLESITSPILSSTSNNVFSPSALLSDRSSTVIPSFISNQIRFRVQKISTCIMASRENIRNSARQLTSMLSLVLPISSLINIDFHVLDTFLDSCLEEFSEDSWKSEARRDAEDFVMEPDYPALHLNALRRHNGSFDSLISELHSRNDPHEFNLERCNTKFAKVIGITPEHLERLRHIAIGSVYSESPDFVRLSVVQDRRALSIALGFCHLKKAKKACDKHKGFLFKISDLTWDDLQQLDFKVQPHSVRKVGDSSSRMCADASHAPNDMVPLNNPLSKIMGIALYPSPVYPTLSSMVQSWYDHVLKINRPFSEFRAYVDDYKGAFTMTKVLPSSARLMAIRVSDDHVAISAYGTFGHQDQAAVFDCVTQAESVVIANNISGVHDYYVDDGFGFGHHSTVAQDHDFCMRNSEDIHGPNSLDPIKRQYPTSTPTIIGWTFDFLKETLCPNDKGIRKMFMVFFVIVDITSKARWSITTIQMLQSIAERYSRGILGMRPFVDCFSKMLTRPANTSEIDFQRMIKKPTSDAKFAVIMWRAVSLSMVIQPEALAVAMSSVISHRHLVPSFFVTTDAGPRTIGLKAFDKNGFLLCYTSYDLPFNAIDCSYQNAREFIATIVALVLIKVHFNPRSGSCVPIHWTSDSKSALAWIVKNKASSLAAQKAFTAYSWILIASGLTISETEHIAGDSNRMHDVDCLSRHYDVDGLDTSLYVNLDNVSGLHELMVLIDPTRVYQDTESHTNVFLSISSCIKDIFASGSL